MNALSSLITFGGGLGLLWLMVILPAALALVCFVLRRRDYGVRALIFFLGAAVDLLFSIALLFGDDLTLLLPWAGFEINLALRLYGFSRLLLFAAGLTFALAALYAVTFLRRSDRSGLVFFYCLLALACANGVFLANNFVTLLFFWETMLAVCFAAQLYNDTPKVRTAVKTLVLGFMGDVMLVTGVALTAVQSGTLMMDVVGGLPVEGLGALGFAGLALGAAARICAVPFQSWLPDAGAEAPLPFVAILPVCLERLTGAYLLLRVCGGFYALEPGSPLSRTLMILGVLSLLCGGMMALIQRNFKRVVAFIAIAQAGLLLLGAGAASSSGGDGALLSLICQVPALMCLLLAVGQLERGVGSVNLRQLGGLGHVMPLTGITFLLAAAAAAGLPPFGSFFANQMILSAVNDADTLIYIVSLLGLFFTVCALLRAGTSCFFGSLRLPDGVSREQVSDAPGTMALPLVVLSAAGLLLGVLVGPVTARLRALAGSTGQGWSFSLILVLIYAIILVLAALNHITGCRATGESLRAGDHIHYLPGLTRIYDAAERHYLDPYNVLMSIVRIYSWLCWMIDGGLAWIYENLVERLAARSSGALRDLNTGVVNSYLLWALGGFAFMALLFLVLV
ncbi:MAG: hypothetical protein IK116_01565 [Firmicutes bacterium]|nr:hypothetical protein [Bacillota bacterium]